MDDYHTQEMIEWWNEKEERFDMFYCFLKHSKNTNIVKGWIEDIEDDMKEEEWECLLDLMSAGAEFKTAKNKILEEKNKK